MNPATRKTQLEERAESLAGTEPAEIDPSEAISRTAG